MGMMSQCRMRMLYVLICSFSTALSPVLPIVSFALNYLQSSQCAQVMCQLRHSF